MFLRAVLRVLSLAIALAVAALVATTPGHAQAGLAGVPVSVCVTPAAQSDDTAALFAVRGRFDCDTAQSAFPAGNYWVRARLPVGVTSFAHPDRIRFASLWQERVSIYARYADGHVFQQQLDGRAVSRHLQLGAVIEQRLPVRQAALTGLLWHVEGSANLRGILLGPRFVTATQSINANLRMATIYACFAGLCFALLVYNLAMWGALRHRFQLAYCMMVAALLFYASSSSGALAWWWPDIANNDRLRTNYLTLGLSAMMALVFARTFFEPPVFAGWVGKVATSLGIMLGVISVTYAALAPWNIQLLDLCYSVAILLLMLFVPLMLWRAYRTRSNYLWAFAIAWAAPVIFGCCRIAINLGLINWSFWLDHSTILSMAAEAVLSSLAIAYRLRLLTMERDVARVQEMAALALADLDPLTGLLNRRAFLRQGIGRAGEQMLLVIDIDHFKRVNETIGHDGGDEVLRVIARALRGCAPADALVARIGGEEFAILAPADDAVSPDDFLARVRSERMPFDLSVTASIGASTGAIATEIDWKQLYRRADLALFDAKAQGRDRARFNYALAA